MTAPDGPAVRIARNRLRTEQSVRDGFGGDSYRRLKTGPDTYQCGCRWERWEGFGEVLVECPFHSFVTREGHDD